MPSPAYQRHLEEVQKLHQSKPLPFFDLADLAQLVRSCDTLYTDALFRKALHPYFDSAFRLVHQLAAMRENLGDFQHHEEDLVRTYGLAHEQVLFNIPIAHGEIREAQQTIYPLMGTMQRDVDEFDDLQKAAEKDITYAIRPNLIVGEKHLVEARFLIPASSPNAGIHVFTIRPKKEAEHPSFSVEQTSITPYATLDLALRKETDPLRLETVLVAQGTEQYSLPETVLPILLRRYVQRLGEGR